TKLHFPREISGFANTLRPIAKGGNCRASPRTASIMRFPWSYVMSRLSMVRDVGNTEGSRLGTHYPEAPASAGTGGGFSDGLHTSLVPRLPPGNALPGGSRLRW